MRKPGTTPSGSRIEGVWLAACVLSALAFVVFSEPLRDFVAELVRLSRKL